MVSFGSRRGAANAALPLMLLSFVLIGGFMYWLSITAEPTEPIVEEEMPEEVAETLAGTLVPVDDLKGQFIMNYEGQVIRLEGVMVSSSMGDQTYFVDLPETENLPAQPFLIRFAADSAGVVAETPAMGARVNIAGLLVPMADSIVTDWLDSGSISENDRILVEFATHFVEIEDWTAAEAPSAGAGAETEEAGAAG